MRKPLTNEERELWRYLESMDGVNSLLDWVPMMTPKYRAPSHLAPLADAFHRADRGEQVFFLSSTPPRHGKSESILAWCARHLSRHPEQKIAYLTYAADFASEQSRKCQGLATRAGVAWSGKASAWSTPQGGGMYFTGVGGQLTGRGFNLMIVDDPIKNREDAESPTIRAKIHEWFTSTALTRLNPEHPPQVIINMARWHDDDLVGRLCEDTRLARDDDPYAVRWEYMNLPAINEAGEALWPKVWNVKSLEQRRRMVGEYDWASLFMGSPMPREGYVFREPARYDLPDIGGARIAIACDPAATAKTSADNSVILVIAAKGSGLSQKAYVLEVWKGQVEIPALVKKLHEVQVRWGAPVFVEAVGGFKAVPQMLRAIDPKLRVVDINPTSDKFLRSMPAKAAWNDGRLLVPQVGAKPWVDEFVAEVTKFTGKGDKKDDQVDALAHAYSAINQSFPAGTRGVVSLPYGRVA
jgi:predicted phage terminase large subunit-like protein